MIGVVISVFLVGILTPLETRQLAERYSQLQTLIEAENYDQAIRKLKGLIKDFGNSEYGDELRYCLAECYFNLGRFHDALEIFLFLQERAKFSYIKPEASLGAAISYVMLENYRKAQEVLEKLKNDPVYGTDPRLRFGFGLLYYFRNSYEEARANLEGLELPEAKLYLGKTYARLGQPFLALLKFREIIEQFPNTYLAQVAHFHSGLALFINHDYDGARAKLQFFVEQFPFSPLKEFAEFFLGCALIAQKDYPAAIRHLLTLTRSSNNFIAASSNYFLGYAQMALGQPEEAVARFQRVRANYPRTRVASYAHLQLVQAMLATADTAQTLLATAQLARMFTTGEFSGVGNYLSGVIFYQLGDYTNAAIQFENVLSNFAQTPIREPAFTMLLTTYNAGGQFDKSIALGTKYLTDYPEEPSEWRAKTLYCLAEAFYYSQKYQEADNFYYQAHTHKASGNIALYARLGRAYTLYHLGRLNEALDGFKALLNSQLNDTFFTISAYLGYGYCLFNQREYLKALDVFEALTNTFPDNQLAMIPGLFYTGYCYYQLKYYGQAVDAWTALMNRFPENNPKVAEAAFRTGDTYFKALEYDKAIAAFKFVVERYPFSDFAPASQALIAQCYYNRRQYIDAIREYQKFLDLYPTDRQVPGVRKSLEMSYFLAGQDDSTLMDEFLSRFPYSEMAAEGQYNKGRSLFDAGRYDEAIVELQKAFVNFPGSVVASEAQLLTAESYARLKRWSEAAQAYKKFLDYFPEHEQRAAVYFNLGVSYFNAGDYKMALAAFQTVVDSFGNSEYAESARKNIEVCRSRLGGGAPAQEASELESSGSGINK